MAKEANQSQARALAQARARAYGLFARLTLEEPGNIFDDIDPIDFLSALRDMFDESNQGIQLIENFFQDKWETEGLNLDYHNLFLVPGPSFVPPYGSVFLEAEGEKGEDLDKTSLPQNLGLKWSKSTKEIQKLFAEKGYEIPKNLPPDHIGIELGFMDFLCTKEKQAWEANQGVNDVRTTQRIFLEEYLNPWATWFCRILYSKAATKFYKGIAKLIIFFLEDDQKYLRTNLTRVL